MSEVPLQDGENMTARFSYSWSDAENNREDPATHLTTTTTTTLAIKSLSAAASGQPLEVTPPAPPVG